MPTRLALAGAGVLLLAACSPAPDQPAPVSAQEPTPGAEADQAPAPAPAVKLEVRWEDGFTPPPEAIVIVEIREAAAAPDSPPLADVRTPVISGSSVQFALPEGAGLAGRSGPFAARARLQHGYAILRASDGAVTFTPGEAPPVIQLFDPEDVARGTPRPMITPAGQAFRCGDEALTIAIEAGAAYVTFADGNSVRLAAADGGAGGTRRFASSRFTLEQLSGPDGADTLRFARGRAAPLPCEPAG